MEAKGYISPVDFQGKRAWKRLVIESDIDEEPLTPEEVRALIEKAKISGCSVYGVNVWDLEGEFDEQEDLIVSLVK